MEGCSEVGVIVGIDVCTWKANLSTSIEVMSIVVLQILLLGEGK